MSIQPNGIVRITKWTPEQLDGALVNFFTGATHTNGEKQVLRGSLKAVRCEGGMRVTMNFSKGEQITERALNQNDADSIQQVFEVGSSS